MKLSQDQLKAIAHRGSHLQIIACAGSGKTEVMARRVASLLEDGIAPAGIIAFTFTERAAASLKSRVHKRIAEAKGQAFLDRLGPMFIGTIHSYCLRMLQEAVPQYGNYDILDSNRLAGLMSREHSRIGLDALGPKHWAPIHDFIKNVQVIENELIAPKAIANTPLGDAYARYVDTLHRYHCLTFGQLIVSALNALKDKAIRDRVTGPLRHLLVDEYQDINPAQEELIRVLARPPVELCVVGDDDQSIYQWRGSDVDNILTFESRYGATKTPLATNRRSRPEIIKRANKFVKTIQPRLAKQMQWSRPDGQAEVHCWAGDTAEDEADTIVETIERLHTIGYRYRDIAILLRSVRTSSQPLIQALRDADIPFRCAGRTGLFRQPEACAFGKLYAWLVDNDWKNDRFEQSAPVQLKDLLDDLQGLFGPTPKLKKHLEDWKTSVSTAPSQVNLVRDYYALLELLSVHDLDLDNPQHAARMGCCARFSQILADYEHVTRRARIIEEEDNRSVRGGQDRGIWFYRKLFSYLQYYALDAYEDFEGEDTFDLDAVDILTVHQSKGLEWPVVFVPCLTSKRFPSGKAGNPQDWLLPDKVFPPQLKARYEGGDTEERRLFYVAMTRARDSLYLSRFRRKKKSFDPSPFLIQVAGSDPDIQDVLPLPASFVPGPDETQDAPTLAFSDLALYERCPLRYRLSTSIGFQPQLATELGYGKAIHHILRRLADLTRTRKKLPTPAQVEQLFTEEFYLPFANRPAFAQLLDRARHLVGKYLSHYSADLLRVWETERPFELHLPQGVIQGRADVILDRENGDPGTLAIVDYKTAKDAHKDDIFAFQLAIYAAAGRGEGLKVEAAYLHELATSQRKPIPVTNDITAGAVTRAGNLIDGIIQQKFPPNPHGEVCPTCDVHQVCKHAHHTCRSKASHGSAPLPEPQEVPDLPEEDEEARSMVDQILTWAEDNPTFDTDFVESMDETLRSRGFLTAGQKNALRNIIAKWHID